MNKSELTRIIKRRRSMPLGIRLEVKINDDLTIPVQITKAQALRMLDKIPDDERINAYQCAGMLFIGG